MTLITLENEHSVKKATQNNVPGTLFFSKLYTFILLMERNTG